MAKFAIVQKSDLKISSVYEAETSLLGTGKFGGPWNDSNLFVHVKLPEALINEPVSNLRAVYELGVTAVQFVPCKCDQGKPIYREAFDKHGQLMVDPKGYPYYAQLFEKQEVKEMIYKIKKVPQ